MKKIIYIIVSIFLVGIAAYWLYEILIVAKRSPKETVTFNDKDLDIKLVYCRPYKKGRLIFGEEKDQALVPYGKYWRLGANAATEITFSKNITFAGKPVSSGTYRMYAVPGPDSFQISLNSELGVTAAHNEPDYTKDIAKADVPVEKVPETEQFTIRFGNDNAGVNMDIIWDQTQVRVPIIPQ